MNATRYEVYQDAGSLWRWRLRAPNGRIVADSAEAYSRRSKAEDAVARVRRYGAARRVDFIAPAEA